MTDHEEHKVSTMLLTDTKEALERVAEARGVALSELVEEILVSWVEENA